MRLGSRVGVGARKLAENPLSPWERVRVSASFHYSDVTLSKAKGLPSITLADSSSASGTPQNDSCGASSLKRRDLRFSSSSGRGLGSGRSLGVGLLRLPTLMLPVAVHYGEAAVFAEGAVGDFDAWRGLAALVFVAVHRGNDLPDNKRVHSLRYHILIA